MAVGLVQLCPTQLVPLQVPLQRQLLDYTKRTGSTKACEIDHLLTEIIHRKINRKGKGEIKKNHNTRSQSRKQLQMTASLSNLMDEIGSLRDEL